MVVGLVVSTGVVRPVHPDDAGRSALDDDVTTVDGTVTVVVAPRHAGLPVTGLRRASGCSAIVLSGGGVLSSSVASDSVSLALVTCGMSNDGPVAWSSCAVSSEVSAIRPANAAMGAITTAAKHPRPLGGSSR